MPIKTGNLRNHYPVRSARHSQYFVSLKLDTGGASAPDGLVPSYGSKITLTHTGGQNDVILTFAEDHKPQDIVWLSAEVVNEPDIKVVFTSYTLATGVLVLDLHTRSTGVALNDADNKEIRILALCTRSDKG